MHSMQIAVLKSHFSFSSYPLETLYRTLAIRKLNRTNQINLRNRQILAASCRVTLVTLFYDGVKINKITQIEKGLSPKCDERLFEMESSLFVCCKTSRKDSLLIFFEFQNLIPVFH